MVSTEHIGLINLKTDMSTKNKEFRVSNGSFLFIFLSAINTHPYMKERIRRYIKC